MERQIYAISNGHLHANWPKTTIGLQKLMTSSIIDQISAYVAKAKQYGTAVMSNIYEVFMKWCEMMMNILQDKEQLPDVVFGTSNSAAMRIASIFVLPTVLPRRYVLQQQEDMLQSAAFLKHLTIEGESSVKLHDVLACGGSVVNQGIPTTDPTIPSCDVDVFGTRTSTVIVYLSMLQLEKDRPQELPSFLRHLENVDINEAAASAVVEDPEHMRRGTAGHFMIMERDLDISSHSWSTNIHSNLRNVEGT